MTCSFCDSDDVFLSPFELPGYDRHFARISDRIRAADRPAFMVLFRVAVNFYCLYLAVGGIAFLVSSLSDRRGRAMGVVFGVLLASFLLNFIAQFWEPARYVSFLSLLNYYQPLALLQSPDTGWAAWPVTDMAVLTGIGVALWAVGGTCFARRDICTV